MNLWVRTSDFPERKREREKGRILFSIQKGKGKEREGERGTEE